MSVVWPTRTPGTSVIAFHSPGVSRPTSIPKSRSLGFKVLDEDVSGTNHSSKLAAVARPGLFLDRQQARV